MEELSIMKDTTFVKEGLLTRGSFEIVEQEDGHIEGRYEMAVFIGQEHVAELVNLTKAFVLSVVAFIEGRQAEGSIEDTEAVH